MTWLPIIGIAISIFAFVTTENLPVGLLDLISTDLNSSLQATGLLVTSYGLTVALASIPLTAFIARWDRKWVLVSITGSFLVLTIATAVAPNYEVLLAVRVAMALAQAAIWGVAAPTVAALVPPARRGLAISIAFSGASAGLVLGVPLGTWFGQIAGWRGAFTILAFIGLVPLLFLISVPSASDFQRGSRGAAPDRRSYAIVVGVTTLAVSGFFVFYTYLVEFLRVVSGLTVGSVSIALFLYGASGVIGNGLAGPTAVRHIRASMVVPTVLLAGALGTLTRFGHTAPLAIVAICAAGFSISALSTVMQCRIIDVSPISIEVASAGNSAAFNLGIAVGSALGSVVMANAALELLPLLGLALAALAVLLLLCDRTRTAVRASD